MKTRTGFVSNSSSTSFLVASKKEADDIEITLTLNVKMNDLAETTIKNKKDLMSYYSDMGFESETDILKESYMIDDYKACLKALEAGKMIHVVVVSSDGGPLEAAIYESDEQTLPESSDYKVISK